MNFGTRFLSIQGVDCQSLQAIEIPCLPGKVVSQEGFLVGRLVWQWISTHGPRLGVVMRRVGIQVVKILGCVLSYPEISDRARSSSASRPYLLLKLPKSYTALRLQCTEQSEA